MNKLIVLVAVASLATTANAATAKAKAAQTKQQASASTPAKDEANRAASASSSNTLKKTSPVSAATGASTITTEAQADAKAGKKLTASFVSELDLDAAEVNYSSNKDKEFSTINYVGLGYKMDAANSVGIRGYFQTKYARAEGNSVTALDPALTYNHKGGSFLGSEAVAPMFWYYAPTSEKSQSLNSGGKLRMDLEVDWMLTPKWSIGYYINPRQSILQDQSTSATVDGKTVVTPVFSRSTLYHWGVLSYNFSDAVSAYGYAGFFHDLRTSTATLVDEKRIAALGMNFTFGAGKFLINPEVALNQQTVKDGIDVASNTDFTAESNLTYALVGSLTF